LKVHEAMVNNPITLEPSAFVFEAAKQMREKKIGSIIVVQKGKVLGIVTERDLVRRVLAENRDPRTVQIHDIMTTPVVTITSNEDIIDAAQLMKAKGIRRLVIIDDGKLIGIITTDDLARNMKRAVEELAITIHTMEERAH